MWWRDHEAECAAWLNGLAPTDRDIIDGSDEIVIPAGAFSREYWSRLFGCDRCHGRGWYPEQVPGTENDYIPDSRERYCDCPHGARRRERETPVKAPGGLEFGKPMSWTGEHALEALNAGLPPGEYGEVRRPKHPPFRVLAVNDGVVTLGRSARWTASFAWNLYESLFELGAVPA